MAPEHGSHGHIHDEACQIAHGDRPVPATNRRLVLAFVSPVAHELAELAQRLGWTVVVIEPEARRMDDDPIPYVRHTAPHLAALRERGVHETDIARVHRPIGLDIGSKSPAEIALSTLAGLLADRNGRSGGAFLAPVDTPA